MGISTLIYAVLPVLGVIVGVIVGSIFQYFSSKDSEKRKHQQDLRTRAYVDFLRGVVDMKFLPEDKKEEAMAILTDAKSRITVYGSKEVVIAIADFSRGGMKLDTTKEMRSFVAIYQAIRKESLPKNQNISESEMCQLLFDTDCQELNSD